MASIQSRVINKSLKKMVHGCFTGDLKIDKLRKNDFHAPGPMAGKKCQTEPYSLKGITGHWLHPRNPSGKESIILYFHGGAYVSGPSLLHWRMLCWICKARGFSGLVVNYRLAPEHPYPAGLEDMEMVYRDLLQSEEKREIIFMGDSAGGGLALALAMKMRDEGIPLPSRLVLLSPWLNQAMDNAAIYEQREKDNMLDLPGLQQAADFYRGERELQHPYISPYFGSLKNLPPTYLMTGTLELLLPDCREFKSKAEQAGMDLLYEEWDDMFHVWMLNVPYIPEALETVSRIIDWLKS